MRVPFRRKADDNTLDDPDLSPHQCVDIMLANGMGHREIRQLHQQIQSWHPAPALQQMADRARQQDQDLNTYFDLWWNDDSKPHWHTPQAVQFDRKFTNLVPPPLIHVARQYAKQLLYKAFIKHHPRRSTTIH